ncbi:MAG: hypothetical protein JWO83_618 [Caulobacteraceae bacterium]|nr:hypothetical protein [Caulobacteraceae bacterium]
MPSAGGPSRRLSRLLAGKVLRLDHPITAKADDRAAECPFVAAHEH